MILKEKILLTSWDVSAIEKGGREQDALAHILPLQGVF
jgi:hypothetical protein